jgi:hypothetical protein|tara:strand:+ start:474 stop:674 length:201 start_codon:yes stop_codon:yes gene_type:complete
MPHCEEMMCHLALLEQEQIEVNTRKQFEEHFVLVKSAEGDYWKPKEDFGYDALKFKQLSIPSADKV